MRYDHFSLLPERAFQKRAFGGMTLEGGGGGGQSQPTQSTVTQTNIPEYARPYVENMLGATQQQLFNVSPTGDITGIKGYTPYSQDPTAYVAGFSPMQQQAFQGIAGLQVPGQYGAATGATAAATQQALGTQYQPGEFGNQYQAPGQYQPGQFSMLQAQAPDLQYFQMGAPERVRTGAFNQPGTAEAYMSPYVQQALAPQLAEMQRQSDIVQQGLKGQAVQAGAFGGTRQALQASEQERNKQALMGQAVGQGYQNAYQQAMQQYSTDAARRLQAQMANQQAGLTAGSQNLAALLGVQQLGAGQNLQAQLANQQALQAAQQAAEQSRQYGYGQGMTSAQLGAQYGLAGQQLGEQSRQYGAGLGLQGLGLGLQGASQLAGLGGQELQAQQGIYGLQQQAGAQQQAQQQNIINQAIQNYATAQQYPQQQLAFMNAMLRGLPLQTATTQTYQAPMSPLGILGGVAGSALGGYMAKTGSMPFKKGGVVDSYTDGGDVDLKPVQTEIEQKVMYHPEQYSQAQIKQGIQDGIVSQLIGIPVLQHKEALAKQMALAQAMGKTLPQEPINREVMAGADQGVMAPMGAGIDQAQIPQDMFNAAGGGIVAFDKGGETSDYFQDPFGAPSYAPEEDLTARKLFGKDVTVGEKYTPGIQGTIFGVNPVPATAKPTDKKPAAETKAPPAAKAPPKPSETLDLTPKETKKAEVSEDRFEKALLAALGATTPTEQDDIKAMGRAIMKGSAQLFGARRGQEGEKIGKGVEEGIDAYTKHLDSLAKDKKELSRIYAEYGLGKDRTAATRESTAAHERVGMAQVEAQKAATAENIRDREFRTAATTLEHLKDKHRKEMEFVPPFLDKEGKPTMDRTKASTPNPKYKSFEQYAVENGFGRLLNIMGITPQQGATRGAVGVNPADFDKKR